jgi:glucose-1-phosphate adenylyltransferase
VQNVLAILLAGGAGERLFPLTECTAKPAVSFGGVYRIIDFTLSNCINSDLRHIFVLTQYRALELNRHLREGWNIFSREMNEFIDIIPPMKRGNNEWYMGTADAVYQNLESVLAEKPSHVLILSGDHIYKMDYREMFECHQRCGAAVTLATTLIPPEESHRFGIVEVTDDYAVHGFQEKPRPADAPRSPFNPEMLSASMGIYLFETETLVQALSEDALDAASAHDFGRDILPRWVNRVRFAAYDFRDLNDKSVRYWRDVGTLDAYYDANMDLVNVTPEFNLYDRRWPIRTRPVQAPPAKFVFASADRRMGVALDSIVSAGCIISGGRVTRSILSPGVRVNSYCEIDSSILMEGSEVGRYSRIQRTIVRPGVRVPEQSVIGFDLDQDAASGYTVTESGVVVVR